MGPMVNLSVLSQLNQDRLYETGSFLCVQMRYASN